MIRHIQQACERGGGLTRPCKSGRRFALGTTTRTSRLSRSSLRLRAAARNEPDHVNGTSARQRSGWQQSSSMASGDPVVTVVTGDDGRPMAVAIATMGGATASAAVTQQPVQSTAPTPPQPTASARQAAEPEATVQDSPVVHNDNQVVNEATSSSSPDASPSSSSAQTDQQETPTALRADAVTEWMLSQPPPPADERSQPGASGSSSDSPPLPEPSATLPEPIVPQTASTPEASGHASPESPEPSASSVASESDVSASVPPPTTPQSSGSASASPPSAPEPAPKVEAEPDTLQGSQPAGQLPGTPQNGQPSTPKPSREERRLAMIERQKVLLLATLSSLDRGLAANVQDSKSVDEIAQRLEVAGGDVVLSWTGTATNSERSTMEQLVGNWRLVYSSGFNTGSLGGSRPGPPVASVPAILGQIYQNIDGDKAKLDNVVEFLLNYNLPPIPLLGSRERETPAIRLNLGHDFSVLGQNTVEIVYEDTSVQLLGSQIFAALPTLELPQPPEVLKPPKFLRSATFNVTYLDDDLRVTRGDRGELRIYLKDQALAPFEDYED